MRSDSEASGVLRSDYIRHIVHDFIAHADELFKDVLPIDLLICTEPRLCLLLAPVVRPTPT